MKQINLLPWREQLRETQKRLFLQALGASFILALIIIFFTHFIYSMRISSQEYRNDLFKQQIAMLDAKSKEVKEVQKQKTQLISRMGIIRDLQANRPLVVHIFDELARVVPDGVFFVSLKREGDTIIVVGKAESNTRVSLLMRNIESSKWLQQPVLSEIKMNPNAIPYDNDFTLLTKQSVVPGDVKMSSVKKNKG